MRVMLTGSRPLARYSIAAGAAPVENDMIALNAAGKAVAATDAAAIKVIGVCVALILVDGVATDVEVIDGIVALANSADAAALARTDRGRPVYVADKDTVSKLAGTNGVVAGLLVDVDNDDVYVDMRPHALAAAAALAVQDANIAALVEPTYAAPVAVTYVAPAAVTYVAPSGGATQDAEARAALAQVAADNVATRAAQAQIAADNVATRAAVAQNAADNAAIIAALIAGGLMAAE